jgi:hypothetical protein
VKTSVVQSHWCKLIEGLEASPMKFYEEVEVAVSRRLIPESDNSRIDWNEAGLLSAKREYLRVKRGPYAIDICGAPFGTGFFFSTWLVEERNSLGIIEISLILAGLMALPFILWYIFGFMLGMLLFLLGTPVGIAVSIHYLNIHREGWDDFLTVIPYVGPLYQHFVRPNTYYKVDTATMFHTAVHAAVVEVVDCMTEAKGIRGLSDLDRKPVMSAVAGK